MVEAWHGGLLGDAANLYEGLTSEMLHGSIRLMNRMTIHFQTKRALSRVVAYCDATGRFAA
jgi:hypothetical protein